MIDYITNTVQDAAVMADVDELSVREEPGPGEAVDFDALELWLKRNPGVTIAPGYKDPS